MRPSWKWIGTAALAMLVGPAAARAQDSGERIRIRPAEVPKELVDLVKKFHPTGTIGQAERRVRPDRKEYRLRIVLRDRIARAEFDLRPGEPLEGTIEDRPWASDLPEGVRNALKKAAGDADPGRSEQLIEIDAEHPEGLVVYKWSLRNPRRRIAISPDGASVRIAERIANDALPQAVLDALKKDFAEIRIRDVDRIALNGQVSYDIDVRGGDDLIATPGGKITIKAR